MMDRWPNQVRMLDGVKDAYARGVKRLCVTSPTGSGKTRSICDVIEWGRDEDRRIALYTYRKLLYEQTARTLEAEGIQFGRRAAGHRLALLKDVQLCMTPTELSQVYKRVSRDLHQAGLVLVDEAHQHTAAGFQRIMADHIASGAMVVGFTATPLDMNGCYDELLVAATTPEMQKIGALVVAETYAPDEPDLRHIRKYQIGVDLTEKDNHKAIMRPGVFGRTRDAWHRLNPEQRPTILFAPDVKGSIWFAEQFHKAGIRAAHIDGTDAWLDGEFHASNQEVRDRIAELSQTGEVKIVCNRFVLREGIDWPWIEVGILAAVFGALTSYIQSGGRLLRAYPNKSRALVIDHGGNWWRHGSLNAEREWSMNLDNHRAVGERLERIREKKDPEPIVCPQCGKVRASGRQCPACGHIAHVKSRLVVQVDGTLRPVPGDIMRPRRVRQSPQNPQLWKTIYCRAKSKKWNGTFRQAEAMFFRENHYYPPRDLPLMPKEPGDWWRKVADVPADALIGAA